MKLDAQPGTEGLKGSWKVAALWSMMEECCDVGEGQQQYNRADVLANKKQRQTVTQSWQRVLPTLQEGLLPSVSPSRKHSHRLIQRNSLAGSRFKPVENQE